MYYSGLGIFLFLKWFYFDFLYFFVVYVGIPLFIIGVLLSLSFTAGMVLLVGGLAVGIYYFVVKGIIEPKPIFVGYKNSGSMSADNKIFKADFKI